MRIKKKKRKRLWFEIIKQGLLIVGHKKEYICIIKNLKRNDFDCFVLFFLNII
jgi:hypothetical protein